MTIDKNRLRALAEACPQDDPLRLMDSHGRRYLRVNHGIVFEVYRPRGFAQFADQNEAHAELALAANPATILALLGEIEHLTESRQEAREMRNKMGDRLDAAEAERDALQAQVAALQADPQSYQSGYDVGRAAEKAHSDNWRVEADGLSRDAKRYRFLRNQHWPVAYLTVVVNPKESVKLGHDCPSGDRLDEQVDEAMNREASHD